MEKNQVEFRKIDEETLDVLLEKVSNYEKFLPTPDANIREILLRLKRKKTLKALTPPERLLLVRWLREQGTMSYSDIANFLGISVPRVNAYIKKLNKLDVDLFLKRNIYDFAMEIYNDFKSVFRLAMRKEEPRSAAYTLQAMVKTLQSLGVIYKAPDKKQIQAQINQRTIHTTEEEYIKFMRKLGEDRKKYEVVVSDLIKAIEEDGKEIIEAEAKEIEEFEGAGQDEFEDS